MRRFRFELGDCRDHLRRLKRVDAVIMDPPYGILYRNMRGDLHPRSFAAPIVGDESQSVGQEVIDLCFSRGWPVCTFAHLNHPWRGPFRQRLVWDKGGAVGGGGDPGTCWKFSAELVQVGGFGKLNGRRDPSVLRFPIGQNSMPYHPNQKPAALLDYLISKLTKPGDVILDPFAGSGATLAAALRLGRRAIGFEIDPVYFHPAFARVNEVSHATRFMQLHIG
jgi:hypothetical protein